MVAIVKLAAIFFFSVITVTVHEFTHGYVAYKLGDPTPKIFKKLTLNPLKHFNLIGTVIFPLFVLFVTSMSFPPVCLAKSVPINYYNFRKPKRDLRLIGLLGPLSNLVLAFLFSLLVHIPFPVFIKEIFMYAVVINITFVIFSLFPTPPMDGAKIVASFLSYRKAVKYLKMRNLSILLFFILIPLGFLDWAVIPLIKFFLRCMGIDVFVL